jgi:hypothetical protein
MNENLYQPQKRISTATGNGNGQSFGSGKSPNKSTNQNFINQKGPMSHLRRNSLDSRNEKNQISIPSSETPNNKKYDINSIITQVEKPGFKTASAKTRESIK